MTEQPDIREEVTRYEVNAMPAGAMDAEQFAIRVERWLEGYWTVYYRGGYYREGDGFRAPSAGRYTREEALRVARELAPHVRVAGMNAAEYQVWAREQVVGRG